MTPITLHRATISRQLSETMHRIVCELTHILVVGCLLPADTVHLIPYVLALIRLSLMGVLTVPVSLAIPKFSNEFFFIQSQKLSPHHTIFMPVSFQHFSILELHDSIAFFDDKRQ